jgi:hypothetical protein
VTVESTPLPREQGERYLSPGQVAGRLLMRVDNVLDLIKEGQLRAEPGGRMGYRIPESALLEFQQRAYRREAFPGLDHGLHSWPTDAPQSSTLPVPAQSAAENEALAPRWPFPHA